jgi:hypothetical protein
MKVIKVIGIGTEHANVALGEQVLLSLESLKYLKNQGRQVFRCLTNNGNSIKLLINGETVVVDKNEKNIIIYNLIAVYGNKCGLTFESTFLSVNSFLNSLSETHRNHFLNNNVAKYIPYPELSNQNKAWKGGITQWQKK